MTKQVNLSDYDFGQPYVARSSKGGTTCDMIASIGVKGKNRKYNNHNLLITTFFKRTNANFQTIAIGTNKFLKRANIIAAFDKNGLQSAPIHNNKGAGVVYVCKKGLILKLFNDLGIQIPEVSGTSTKLHLNLEEVEGQVGVYSIIPVKVERVDAYGEVKHIDLQKSDKRDESRLMV